MSSNALIVVLAAGKGARFADHYDIPKPLIEFRHRPLLSYALDVAEALTDDPRRVVVVTTPAVRVHVPHKLRTVLVTATQPGPAASGLLALAHAGENDPIVFVDCDNVYTDLSFLKAAPFGRAFLSTALLPAPRPEFCCVHPSTEGGGTVYVTEKTSDSRIVGTGIYGFPTAKQFREAAWGVLLEAAENREPPMSEVLSEFDNIHALPVTGRWSPVGTPQQLMEALND